MRLESCSTCCQLFSLLDEKGRCERCAERWSFLTNQPISAVFQKPQQVTEKKRAAGRPVVLKRHCQMCQLTKPSEMFPKRHSVSVNLRGLCLECVDVHREQRSEMKQLNAAYKPTGSRGGGWLVPADTDGRYCRGCSTFKPWDDFYRASNGFNGRASRCKWCTAKPLLTNKRVVDSNGRTCTRCGEYKPWAQYYKKKNNPHGHLQVCIECYRRLYARIES